MNDPNNDPQRATSVEKVFGALVNLAVGGYVAEALGAPAWVGRAVSALGMAAVADESVPPALRAIGRATSAPGALTIGLLRDQGIPVLEKTADSMRRAGDKVSAAVDAEFSEVK